MKSQAYLKPSPDIKRDYSSYHPPQQFMKRHGKRIGVLLYFLSACAVTAFFVFVLAKLAPGAIEQMQDHSRQIVAESRGVAE